MKNREMHSKKEQRTMWLIAAGLLFAASLIAFVRNGMAGETVLPFVLGCMFFVCAFIAVEDSPKS